MEEHLDTEPTQDVAGDDLEFLNELWDIYEEEFARSYAEIEKACEEKDWKRAQLYSHNIKSGSLNIGAVKISAQAHKMEEISKEARLNDLIQELTVLTELKGHLDQAWKIYMSQLSG